MNRAPRCSFSIVQITRHAERPQHQTPVKIFGGEKMKKNLTGKKRLIIVSKLLFDLKVKGYQGTVWVAM
jgi:hypothetical protein